MLMSLFLAIPVFQFFVALLIEMVKKNYCLIMVQLVCQTLKIKILELSSAFLQANLIDEKVLYRKKVKNYFFEAIKLEYSLQKFYKGILDQIGHQKALDIKPILIE